MNVKNANVLSNDQSEPPVEWAFSDLIADPEVGRRWNRIRRYFYLRESTYDMTRRCNIRCEGCYYYEGEKQHAREVADPRKWRALMKSEKARDITYVVLAGAEPALVPELLAVCYEEMQLGAIATNGIKRIPQAIGYKIHISVWGNDDTSRKLRGADDMLQRQIDNYQSDPRAVFVYTFTPHNIEEARQVARQLAATKSKITFNVFSAPVGYDGGLRHTPESLQQTRQAMIDLLQDYPEAVLFSHYNAVAHTHCLGIDNLFGCTYPRRNPAATPGLGRSFRQYRTDLNWDRQAACCVPDTDCADCRHYAAGSAVVTARLFRHACNPEVFRSWLDYVDTYLAVWVSGYEKGSNLCGHAVAPPGHDLF